MKKTFIIFFFLLSISINAQKDSYTRTFDWVVETFMQNDAGFQYIIDKKGENDYKRFTQGIRLEVANANNDEEFIDFVYEWLHYFRKAHIQFGLKDNPRKHISRSNFKDDELHLDSLSDKTLYLRIPSFAYSHKTAIDSLINTNKELINCTPNLIIDIRNGTGGSDASFQSLLPLIYTSPIRQAGMVFKGSEANAQGFERYAKELNNPDLNDIAKLLRDNDGKFVPIGTSDKSSVIELDKVSPYPQRIAIIIDEGNVSSDEQFLIYAKQSWKVKLFGRTTTGGIDISNLTYTFSPDEKFVLVHGMSKSKRIPDFIIDDIGIQPDFYIDNEVADDEWINYVKSVLE